MSNIISRGLVNIRNSLSTILEYELKSTKWEPDIPLSVDEIPEYMGKIFTWKQDPLWGICDYIQPIGHMNWQLKNKGLIYGDCDDHAQYISRILYRLGYRLLARVNMLDKSHVILVFMENNKTFSVFSNSNYTKNGNTNIDGAISYYCDSIMINKIANRKSNGEKFTKEEITSMIIRNRSANYVVETLVWDGSNMVVKKK
jgi:hypothetical protein